MAITIKDVAKKAETSITTVSKVINHHPSISDATRKRVMDAIDDLGYIPNERARNFASKKTYRVAFVTKIEPNMAFINPHLFEVMIGAQRHLFKSGYQMEFIGLKKVDLQTVKLIVTSKRVDGILFHASLLSNEIAKYLGKSQYPHAVIGMPNFPSTVCWIDNNNELSGRLAARHLLSVRKKNLAYIGGEGRDLISEIRLTGVKKELEEHQVEINKDFVMYTDSSYEDAYQKTLDLLAMKNRPNAIICANNMIDLGCMTALKDQGIKIPEEMAVVTFDDYPYAHVTNPPTTTINIDVYDLGFQAARLLIENINKPNYVFQTYLTVPLLVVRESTKKPYK